MTRHGDMRGLGEPVETQEAQACAQEKATGDAAQRLSDAIRARELQARLRAIVHPMME